MRKEVEVSDQEFGQLIEVLGGTFIQRRDLHSRQMDDGSYICVRKPLKDWHLRSHLKGEITLGTYVLDTDSQARFITIDADDDWQFEQLFVMASELKGHGITAYLETSRRGGHLWMFFNGLVPGKDARSFGKGLLLAYDLRDIELFPKQNQLKSGPGSLIRLPFGVHRKSGSRYGFFTTSGMPMARTLSEQIYALRAPLAVPQDVFDAYKQLGLQEQEKNVLRASESLSGSLSERIKDGVTVMDFVGQYVELSPNGRGICPFHDDRHASFSVNTTENYWYCFAGCGGGSVIDFWMKYRDCEFREAVKELAQALNL